MKKIFTTTIATLFAICGFSQTNTFPSSGSTGIGTTTPASTLEIKDSSPVITLTSSTYNNLYRSYFGARSGAQAYLIFGNSGVNEVRAGNTAAGGFLDFYTNNTVGMDVASDGNLAMRLAANGNVGIGTNAPQYKLHVNGISYFSGDITTLGKLNLATSNYDGTLILGSNATWRSGISQRDAGNAEMRIWTKGASPIYFANEFDGTQSGATLPTDGMKFAGNSLGIGSFTVNEAIGYKLHVKGTSKFTEDALFDTKLNANTLVTNSLLVDYQTDPTSGNKLAVNGTSYFSGDITTLGKLNLATSNYDGTLILGSNATWRSGISQRDAGNAEMRIWTKGASPIYFANEYDGTQLGATLPTDGMKLAANNLGIGSFTVNEAIGYKLHVKGTSNFTDQLSGASATFSGTVGIGTTTVEGANKLQVNGGIKSSTLTLSDDPVVSTGSYDILTRNSGTNIIEKISSNALAPATGSANYIHNQIAAAQTGNIWVSGQGKFGSLVVEGADMNVNATNIQLYTPNLLNLWANSIKLTLAPGISATGYDLLTRNSTTGIIERIPSNSYAVTGRSLSQMQEISAGNFFSNGGGTTQSGARFNKIGIDASYPLEFRKTMPNGDSANGYLYTSATIGQSGNAIVIGTNDGGGGGSTIYERMRVDATGLKLPVAPTSAAGSYNILTQNSTTGYLEKISSGSIVSGTGTPNRIPFYNSSGLVADDAGFTYNPTSGLTLGSSRIKISGGSSIEIGNGASSGTSWGIAIGNAAIVNPTIASECPIAIGAGATTGTSWRGIAMGLSASTNNFNSIVFGREAEATASGQLIFGRSTQGNALSLNSVYFNGVQAQGSTTSGQSVSINGAGAGPGNDLSGGSLTLASGKGTGAGTPGDLVFQTPALGVATTSTLQTSVPRMTIKGGTGEVIFNYLNTSTYAQSFQSPGFTGTIGNPTLAQDFYANTNGNDSGIRSRYRTLQAVGTFDFRHDSGLQPSFRMYMPQSGIDESTLRETFRFKSDGTLQFFPTLSSVTGAIKSSSSLLVESNNNGSVVLRSASNNGSVLMDTYGGISATSRNISTGPWVNVGSFTQAGNGVAFSMLSKINTNGGSEGLLTMSGSYATRFTISPGTTAGGGILPTTMHIKSGDAQPANSGVIAGANMYLYGGSGVNGGKIGNVVLQNDGSSNKGNVLVGTTTDDGINKLQVYGSIKSSDVMEANSFKINSDPAPSSTGYDILTRNTSTGLVEKVASSSIAIDQSNIVHKSGDEAIFGIKTFNGNIGIGTTNPGTYQLAVKGTIKTQAIKVDPTDWSDYVFYKSYKLPSLKDVESFITEKQHLPDIPSEAEVKKNGIELGEMNSLLLKKIEELTLYMIEKDKQLEKANEKIDSLAKKVEKLAKRR